MLPDIVGAAPPLVLFVGSAKSVASAKAGHYYAHPQNRFWHLLDVTGLTGHAGLTAADDNRVVEFGLALTDLVHARAESSDSRLRAADFETAGFVAKVEVLQPKTVAFTSARSAAETARHLGHPPPPPGPGPWTINQTLIYRLPSPSPANASIPLKDKEEAWRAFGDWARDLD